MADSVYRELLDYRVPKHVEYRYKKKKKTKQNKCTGEKGRNVREFLVR